MLHHLFTRSGSPEGESWLLNPTDEIFEAFGSTRTHTGKRVSEEKAPHIAAFLACVRVIAETGGILPLILYKRSGTGKVRAYDHPKFSRVSHKPNESTTAHTFLESLYCALASWGNAYVEVLESGELRSIEPKYVTVRLVVVDGVTYKVLEVREKGKDRRILLDFIHIPGFGFDGIVGRSPVSLMGEALGLALAQEEHAARFFGQGARPAGIITHPKSLKAEARNKIRETLTAAHAGLEGSHRLAVLDEGMEYKGVSVSSSDAELLDSRRFQVKEIARGFRMPPHKIGDLEHATYSNIEEQGLDFYQTMIPYFKRVEQAFSCFYLTPQEVAEGYFYETLVDAILRGDSKTRAEIYASYRQWGIMSANDVRDKENMNQIGPQGDIYLIPANMFPADLVASTSAPDSVELEDVEDEGERVSTALEATKKSRDAERARQALKAVKERRAARAGQARYRLQAGYERLFEAAARSLLGREVKRLRAALRKALKQDDPLATFERLAREIYEDLEGAAAVIYGPVVTALADLIADSVEDEIGQKPARDQVDTMAKQFAEGLSERHGRISQGSIRKRIEKDPDQWDTGIGELLDGWEETRAARAARAETVRASGALTRAALASVGVMTLRWFAVGKSCPFCSDMDGRTVGIQESFLSSGSTIDPKADGVEPMAISKTVNHPPVHGGCDCVVVAG